MTSDLALDFGSATTRVVAVGGHVLLEEPTVAAVDDDTARLLVFGREALDLGVRGAGRVLIVRPVRGGQLVDVDLAEKVLADILERVGVTRFSRPRVLVCVHVDETQVQRRAIERALRKAGVREVLFIEYPIACAVGAGLEIQEPRGTMVVDVGAGRTDIGVLALGGLVSSTSLLVGGDTFDEAIRDYVARVCGVAIDRDGAETVKRSIGTVAPDDVRGDIEVPGRAIQSGRLERIVLSSVDLFPVLRSVAEPLLDAAAKCIASAPPDLANDLLGDGLFLSGGGALLGGFDRALARATGIPVHVTDDAGAIAAKGAARCLSMMDSVAAALSSARRHQER